MSSMKAPPILPDGWEVCETPVGTMAAWRRFNLQATASHEYYDEADGDDCPPLGFGLYVRIVISRPNRYPDWNEMRDLVYSCGLFDHSRDVVMLLPPPEKYVNLHNNAFHFFQLKEPKK